MCRGKARGAGTHWNFWDQLEPKGPVWVTGILWAKLVPLSRGEPSWPKVSKGPAGAAAHTLVSQRGCQHL